MQHFKSYSSVLSLAPIVRDDAAAALAPCQRDNAASSSSPFTVVLHPCSCKLNDGQPCYTHFTTEQIQEFQESFLELSEEKQLTTLLS